MLEAFYSEVPRGQEAAHSITHLRSEVLGTPGLRMRHFEKEHKHTGLVSGRRDVLI